MFNQREQERFVMEAGSPRLPALFMESALKAEVSIRIVTIKTDTFYSFQGLLNIIGTKKENINEI